LQFSLKRKIKENIHMTKEKNCWKIECSHTPETIDRILLPIRKRGIKVMSLHYQEKDSKTATCTIEFEVDSSDVDRVYKNMLRIHDILNVTKL
jgi:acetolactate synthase regulatory subunit